MEFEDLEQFQKGEEYFTKFLFVGKSPDEIMKKTHTNYVVNELGITTMSN